jgi:spermidine synthase
MAQMDGKTNQKEPEGNYSVMSHLILWLIIFIEGFVTISTEILTIRQMLPIAGGSVIVTSLIIGIFLLFLAYGYRRGGEYEGDYSKILQRNFTLSAFWLGIGLSYIFIRTFFSAFHLISNHVLLILTAYLLLITAPLVYILGQTVPITMNLIRKSHTVGGTGGKILHLSTIGSFFGAIITSLLLMNFLGVAWTIIINYVGLMFLSILLIKDKQAEILRIVILTLGLLLTYAFNVYIEKTTFALTNSYANYQVIKDNGNKTLSVNGSMSSFISSQNKGFAYIELIKRILFSDLQLKDKDILVLGAGGFSLSAAGTNGNRFTYVDIDKDIEKVVREHFLKNIQGNFLVDDARYFLNTTENTYDVIFSDVYSSARSIPSHLLTQEYFATINRVLRPNGIVIINIIAKPMMEDEYSQNIDTTIRSVFNHCMVMPTHYSTEVNNIVYLCRRTANSKHKNLYTDDLNQAPFDFFNLYSK